MMHYANHPFDGDYEELAADQDGEKGRKKDYSRGRANVAQRRRAKRRTSAGGCGIAARRNKRFAW